jgi:hypothetical protein
MKIKFSIYQKSENGDFKDVVLHNITSELTLRGGVNFNKIAGTVAREIVDRLRFAREFGAKVVNGKEPLHIRLDVNNVLNLDSGVLARDYEVKMKVNTGKSSEAMYAKRIFMLLQDAAREVQEKTVDELAKEAIVARELSKLAKVAEEQAN